METTAQIDTVTGEPTPQKSINGAANVFKPMPGASTPVALGGTTKVVALAGYPIPSVFTLKSSDVTRKIEFSTDGGTEPEYFAATYDAVSATMLVAGAEAGLSHVKFTGLTNDTWSAC